MIPEQSAVVDALVGKECWYVSCGGPIGSSFELAFGSKVPRRKRLKNPTHTEDFRNYEGESNLLVWCTWRLDSPTQPISGADATQKHFGEALQNLVGANVKSVVITAPGWDMKVVFSNGLTLNVFCDHVGDEPSFSSNWELWGGSGGIVIAAGSVPTFEPSE